MEHNFENIPVWSGVIQAVEEILTNVEIVGETQWLTKI